MNDETKFVVGHKNKLVILQHINDGNMESFHIAWTPTQARQVAALILAAADAAEAVDGTT